MRPDYRGSVLSRVSSDIPVATASAGGFVCPRWKSAVGTKDLSCLSALLPLSHVFPPAKAGGYRNVAAVRLRTAYSGRYQGLFDHRYLCVQITVVRCLAASAAIFL